MDEESNMLVLSRKVGQELVIGDNIRITVNRVGGSRVTLGIEAPDEVRIVRAELEPIVRSFERTDETKERRETQQQDSAAVNPTVLVDTSEGLTDVSSHLQS
jgi:carbon storage regulator